jgi:hypothetical protein
MSSCAEHSVSSDEEENVSANSRMQHGNWVKSGAKRPHFTFTAKPSKPLEYFELFCTPETV